MNGKVCGHCRIEMYPKKNDVIVIELASFGPDKIWRADLWACRDCNSEIIVGFAKEAFTEHFHKDFQEILSRVRKISYCIEVKEGSGVAI